MWDSKQLFRIEKKLYYITFEKQHLTSGFNTFVALKKYLQYEEFYL